MIKKIILSTLLLSSFLFSENEPNNRCSSAETIQALDGLSTNGEVTERGWVHERKDQLDIYKFTVQQNGKINIIIRGNKTNYSFFVGSDCAHLGDRYSNTRNKANKTVPEFNVLAGETVYLTIQRRYKSWMKYSMDVVYVADDIIIPPDPVGGDFTLKYYKNLKGNIRVIGNTMLYGNKNTYNSHIKLTYVDMDKRRDTFNSSQAEIEKNEHGINLNRGNIIWAGMFWQGYLHNDDEDPGIDSHYNFSNTQSVAKNQIKSVINNHKLTLRLSDGAVHAFSPDEVDLEIQYEKSDYISYRYSAFTNITDFLKGKKPNMKYTVSNLPVREGKTQDGDYSDGLGNFGAWSLVVVYENQSEENEKTRNVSVFKGYETLSKDDNPETTILLSGFKTPATAPQGVDSTISIFAGEGDKLILGDYATLVNQENYSYDLPNATGTDSYFASSIEGVPKRTPKLSNNNGIDIHTTQVGTIDGNDRPIKIDQTRAYLKLGTTGDTYMPSMVAFATELYTPKLCYDYDARLGENIKLNSTDREIDTSDYGKDLSLKVLIRSQVSDFDLTNVKMKVNFIADNSSDELSYIKKSSFVSPPFINAYIKVPDQTPLGTIAIGTLNSDKKSGIIQALESTYAKQKFKFKKGHFKGHFDITVSADIKFDEITELVHYDLSTSGGSIPRCDTDAIYNPIWGEYNIERVDSKPSQRDEIRYPLYTQVAGKNFQVAVRRYALNTNTDAYDDPLPVVNTVDLEVIDASLFNNNSLAGYDSSCEDPDKIGDSAFIHFDNSYESIVNVPADIPNFNNDIALKNVAFRVWYFGVFDIHNQFTMINHSCNLNNKCFNKFYKDELKVHDTTKTCLSACSANSPQKTCYKCLKINFARPVCSRDNFAIKPDSFNVKINDNNEGDDVKGNELIKSKDKGEKVNLVSEYNYDIDIEALLYNSEIISKGYYKNNYRKETLSNIDAEKEYILLSSNNSNMCYDKNHYSYNYIFVDSKIYDNSKFTHKNVGEFKFFLNDNTWTEVDQANYINKNSFNGIKTNDCILSDGHSNQVGKIGCEVKSNISDNINKNKLNIAFKPYSYSFSEVSLQSVPGDKDILFMNDFSAGYFDINSMTMGLKAYGLLSAIGKSGTILTNFTNSCVAEDITISIDRKTAPIAEKDLFSTKNGISVKDIFIQQYLSMINSSDQLSEGIDSDVLLRKTEFTDITPGKGDLSLYLTFKKPLNRLVLPIKFTLESLIAQSDSDITSINKDTNYKPVGQGDYNKTVDYFFGKITPQRLLYGPTKEGKQITPLYVDIYCEDSLIYNCADFGLLNTTKGLDENTLSWYTAEIFSRDELGKTDLSVKTILGNDAKPIVRNADNNSDKNINFNDNPASQKDVYVQLTTDDRPSVVEVEIIGEPWLLYDENDINGHPKYRIKFIGDSAWSGIGNTGEVINSKAVSTPTRRILW